MKWMVNCSVVNPRIRLYPEHFPRIRNSLELIMESLSNVVRVHLPSYLRELPVPNSFFGWFSLGISDWAKLVSECSNLEKCFITIILKPIIAASVANFNNIMLFSLSTLYFKVKMCMRLLNMTKLLATSGFKNRPVLTDL